MTGCHPNHPAGIMVDDNGHKFMPFAVAGFINADLFEPVKVAFRADIHVCTDTADNEPTEFHDIRMNWETAILEQFMASHTTVYSKSRVYQELCRAYGTAAETTPCSRQLTQ